MQRLSGADENGSTGIEGHERGGYGVPLPAGEPGESETGRRRDG
jgi:hypothetical protein